MYAAEHHTPTTRLGGKGEYNDDKSKKAAYAAATAMLKNAGLLANGQPVGTNCSIRTMSGGMPRK